MEQNYPGDDQMLKNLADALLQQNRQGGVKLQPANDQDILRAMLGKPWPARPGNVLPARKAG